MTIDGVDSSRLGSAADDVIVWIDNWSEQYPVGDWECSIPGLSFCHSRTRTSPFPPITSEPTAPPIGRRNTSRSDYADLVILKGGGG